MVGFPRGTIVQTERGRAHRTFIDTVQPEYVLLKIQYARQLLKRGKTADQFPEEVAVITTTSIRDGINAALPLESNGYKRGEWDIVREFEPDFHIPADRSDYQDFDDETRYERVRDCMKGTIAMANHVAESDISTTVLPWIKGVSSEERRLTWKTIEQLGMEYVVFYANGYFNDGGGNRRRQLVEDLEYLVEEGTSVMDHTDELEICVLSCQSPQLLEKMPSEVVASSGLWVGQNRGWRDTVHPTTQSTAEIREIFTDVNERVRDALGLEQQGQALEPAETATQKESQSY